MVIEDGRRISDQELESHQEEVPEEADQQHHEPDQQHHEPDPEDMVYVGDQKLCRVCGKVLGNAQRTTAMSDQSLGRAFKKLYAIDVTQESSPQIACLWG